jgi:hypothetical protein
VIGAIEQAIENAVHDGLIFPIIVVLVSSRAEVWAMEVSEGQDGLEQRELCDNLSGEMMAMPIILYLSDRSRKTFQATIESGKMAQA